MTIFGILFYMIVAYFVVSVGSFYILMKRKTRNADLIVQSVSQGMIGSAEVTTITLFKYFYFTSRTFEGTR